MLQEDRQLHGNALAAVVAQDGGKVTLLRCAIHHNTLQAVHVRKDGVATVQDCDVTGNAAGPWLVEEGGRLDKSGNKE